MLALFMAAVMLLSIASPVYAGEAEIVGISSLVEVDGFVFEIVETQIENEQTVRTFERRFAPFIDGANLEEAKALLLALGLDQRLLDKMSIEDLKSVASSPRISTTISHVVKDIFGDTRYVTGAYAEEYAANVNALLEEQYELMQNYGIMPLGSFNNGVLRITHSVIHEGGSEFFFLTSADWMTSPAAGAWFSVGSYGRDLRSQRSGTGSASWTTVTRMHATNQVTNSFRQQPLQSIQVATPSLSYWGMGGSFNRPRDIFDTDFSLTHTNFFAMFSHRATWIDTVGNFFPSRSTISTGDGINPSLSLSISLSGPSIGIGFSENQRTTFNTTPVDWHRR